MCELKYKLSYKRTDNASVLFDFYCGIDEMDSFIHDKLQGRIDRKDGLLMYVIEDGGQTVAMTAVKESTIEVHIEGKGRFDVEALEIEYLAVRKELQRKHIGKQVISWIEDSVLNDYPDSKFISVRAFVDRDINYSAVPFYRSCGFSIIQKPHPMANNVKMAKRVR